MIKKKILYVILFLLFVIFVILLLFQIPRRVKWKFNESPNTDLPEYTEIQIIQKIAKKYGIETRDLVAMAMQESSFNVRAIGDNGCSRGMWQVNLCVFPEMQNRIGDIEAEAEFVAIKLIQYGYANGYKTRAIARYNAPYRPNWQYALKVKNKINEAEKLLNEPISQNKYYFLNAR